MIELDWHSARAALEWQVDLGVTDAISDAPINRYEVAKKPAKVAKPTAPVAEIPPQNLVDPVEIAKALAAAASDLPQLQSAMAQYDHCDLKLGAKNLVFSDGVVGARVMIIGEAPGREEDQQGKPFVGQAGQLLNKMLAAIDLERTKNVYITNVVPWRPPQNREPTTQEIAMMMPFLQRHVELANPDIILCMGNPSCQAVLGKRGITKIRGTWSTAFDRPVMPMLHPAYLLRTPLAKRMAWEDLLQIKAWLRSN